MNFNNKLNELGALTFTTLSFMSMTQDERSSAIRKYFDCEKGFYQSENDDFDEDIEMNIENSSKDISCENWTQILLAHAMDLCETYVSDLLSSTVIKESKFEQKLMEFITKRREDLKSEFQQAINHDNDEDKIWGLFCSFSKLSYNMRILIYKQITDIDLFNQEEQKYLHKINTIRNKVTHLYGFIDEEIKAYGLGLIHERINISPYQLIEDYFSKLIPLFAEVDKRALDVITIKEPASNE